MNRRNLIWGANMNRLTLSCLKSVVQTRSKGDWDFLTKLILVWPRARAFYWTKQGFRDLLGTWPFLIQGTSHLHTPEGPVLHGFQLSYGYGSYVFMTLVDQGKDLIKIAIPLCFCPFQEDLEALSVLANQANTVWVPISAPCTSGPETIRDMVHMDWTDLDFGPRLIRASTRFPEFRKALFRAVQLIQTLTPIKFRVLEEMVHLLAKAGLGNPDLNSKHE